MTFLEPILLWGLPLALTPVVIHLFNRLRHRSVDWGAMMFLRSANRKSTRYAKVRQWLILALRVLALVALVLAISRPLAGGWLGWMLRPAPDAIVMILDRSPSMEHRLNEGTTTRREEALRLFAQSARSLAGVSRLVLIDSALRTPQELAGAEDLERLSLTRASDTAADFPALVQAAIDWINRTRPGTVEIWLASDLQQSNWQPQSDRWPALAAQLGALPQTVRVRLLAVQSTTRAENISVALRDLQRRPRANPPELELVLDIERGSETAATIPLTVTVDGSQSPVEVQVTGQTFRYRHKVTLDPGATSGSGKVELSADANLRDNTAYFVYSPTPPLKTAVVATDGGAARALQLAAAPIPGDTNQLTELTDPARAAEVGWQDYALVLWQVPLPQGPVARSLRAYLEAGGVMVCFAPGASGTFAELGLSWGEPETAAENKSWSIDRWQERDGPLARTEEGLSLPLNELNISKRQAPGGFKTALANYEDGGSFLARANVGGGQILFCGSSLAADWSDLRDGLVLVPLVQRMLTVGAARLQRGNLVTCGENAWLNPGETPVSLDPPGKDLRVQAGVYRTGGRLVAVNRPAQEDETEKLGATEARALFAKLDVKLFEDKGGSDGQLQSELWRGVLFLMLLLLVGEAILILPPPIRVTPATTARTGGTTVRKGVAA